MIALNFKNLLTVQECVGSVTSSSIPRVVLFSDMFTKHDVAKESEDSSFPGNLE